MPSRPSSEHELTIVGFEEMTKNAGRVQREVLSKILSRNAKTKYLDRLGVNGSTDEEAFQRAVPLVTHDHLKDDIQRIVDGDTSPILMADPIHSVSLSSGTTKGGVQKYIPFYKEALENTNYVGRIGAAFRSSVYPIDDRRGKCLGFLFCGRTFKTEGGLEAGTISTHVFRSKEFKSNQSVFRMGVCSPEAIMSPTIDYKQAMYCHLLCGLLYRDDVQYITSTFAYTIVQAFLLFQEAWQDICKDIREGHLSTFIKNQEVREAMSHILVSCSSLANIVAECCLNASNTNNWLGLIPRLWPQCKYVLTILTGTMEPYVKKLQEFTGDLPLIGADYGCTENWIGVNTKPQSPISSITFTIVPTFAYFEFLPLTHYYDHGELPPSSATVRLTDIQIGHDYEIVMTTFGGLYRYRLGDVVRVTGFYNSSPCVAIVCRKNVLLSIHIDKTTEHDLVSAVSNARKILEEDENISFQLVDFTSYAHISTNVPGHYVVFWEVQKVKKIPMGVEEHVKKQKATLEACASLMDKSFQDPGYIGSRGVGAIGPLEIRLVKPGTFQRLLDRYLSKCVAAINQYKTPRCIKCVESIAILSTATTHSYFSTAYQKLPLCH